MESHSDLRGSFHQGRLDLRNFWHRDTCCTAHSSSKREDLKPVFFVTHTQLLRFLFPPFEDTLLCSLAARTSCFLSKRAGFRLENTRNVVKENTNLISRFETTYSLVPDWLLVIVIRWRVMFLYWAALITAFTVQRPPFSHLQSVLLCFLPGSADCGLVRSGQKVYQCWRCYRLC